MTDRTLTGTAARSGAGLGTWAAPVAVFLMAALLRVGGLGWAGTFDEFYHVLAAQGFLETGTFRIGDGSYDRAPLYTLWVAGLLWLGDGSLAVVRGLSMVFGAGLAAALFLWVRRIAGPVAAWVAAAFAILWPEGIFLSEYIRFYTAHGLAFFLGAIAVYHAMDAGRPARSRAWLAAAAALSFGVALHFTPLTAVGLVPLLLWIGIVAVLPALLARPQGGLIVAGLVVLGLVLAPLLWVAGPLETAWEMFRNTPKWAERRQDDLTYYHMLLRDAYPSLWPLTPVAALIAIAHRPRAGLFVTLMATGILAMQSIGGMKAERYIYYGMPFLFAIWGVAAAAVAGPALRALEGVARDAVGTVLPPRWVRPAAVACLVAAAGMVLASNRVLDDTLALARHGPEPELGMDWTAAAEPLRDALATADVVATSKELQALYHLGRADVILSASRMTEIPDPVPFGIDHRTGRPVLDGPTAMARLMACTADGLAVMPAAHADSMADFLSEVPDGTTLAPVALPEAARLAAVTWTTPRPAGGCGDATAALPPPR